MAPSALTIKNPLGIARVIAITGATAYESAADARTDTDAVTFPVDSSADVTYWFPGAVAGTLSVTQLGREVAGHPDGATMPFRLESRQRATVSPGFDSVDSLAVAAGSAQLPPLAQALTFFEGLVNAGPTYADVDAQKAAWVTIPMAPIDGYEAYPGVQPVMGEWSNDENNTLWWSPTEPGVYSVYSYQHLILSGAAHANGYAVFREPMSKILAWSWGPDAAAVKPAPHLGFLVPQTRTNMVFASQRMIDEGWAGLAFRSPEYWHGDTERVTAMYLMTAVERVSPGSSFDYYDDL